MSVSYRIGEVARLTGVSVETIRYYERRRLLIAPPRTDGGFRRYAPEVVAEVGFIRQAQALGLTLEDVHQLMNGHKHRGPAGCRRVCDLLDRRIIEVDSRIAQLRTLRKTLAAHLSSCTRALGDSPNPECPTLQSLGRVQI
ncbi:MAG: MerR family transcriptional regulator [Acidobacteria bacterium]|nr:MerR family transcriptional regulator [Acidobacteriota bacterium]